MTERVPDNLDEPVPMVPHPEFSNVWVQPEIELTAEQQAELHTSARDGDRCMVAIHHGPGHQSVTECEVEGAHEQHEVRFGEFAQYATWTGDRDVFSGYLAYDDFDEDNISYVRDDWTLKRRRRMAEFYHRLATDDYHGGKPHPDVAPMVEVARAMHERSRALTPDEEVALDTYRRAKQTAIERTINTVVVVPVSRSLATDDLLERMSRAAGDAILKVITESA